MNTFRPCLLLYIIFLCISLGIADAQSAQPQKRYTFEEVDQEWNVLREKVKVKATPVPLRIRGNDHPLTCLNGKWQFNPTPSEGFFQQTVQELKEGWSEISVPGEWYMEGYSVPNEKYAGYVRSFRLPHYRQGNRYIIRFGAVESTCRVYVNGKKMGEHSGSMTAFEFDITDAVLPGENTLALEVCSESPAGSLSKISHYAKHQVGGILRDVTVVEVPPSFIDSWWIKSYLSEDLTQGTVDISLSLDGVKEGQFFNVMLRPLGARGFSKVKSKVLAQREVIANDQNHIELKISGNDLSLWHAETPFLYELKIELRDKEGMIESIVKKVGFKKIEIIENVFYVNDRPVKLHGVARHDITAYGGRAFPGKDYLEKEIKLFRDAHINFIRTSHYSPDQALIDLCDEYGIFMECEAPVCWDISWSDAQEMLNDEESLIVDYLRTLHSLVLRAHANPSVIVWSLANESRWKSKFYAGLLLLKELMPEIPVTFSHSEYFGINDKLDIGARHYPGWQGIQAYSDYFRPIIFGEVLHLNTYNTSENITDPGLRDMWGEYMEYFVDQMQEAPAITGFGIWSAIDEMFYPKNNLPSGYGPWGIIDGFARQKPEYWHTLMACSPVKILSPTFQIQDGKTMITLANRFNTLDLSVFSVKWKSGKQSGVAKCSLPPMSQGTLILNQAVKGSSLDLEFTYPDGSTLLKTRIPREKITVRHRPSMESSSPVTLEENDRELVVHSGETIFSFSKEKGELLSIVKNGEIITSGAVKIYAIPLTNSNEMIHFVPVFNESEQQGARFTSDPLSGTWVKDSMTMTKSDHGVTIRISGKYGDVPVTFTYCINGDSRLKIDYKLNLKNLSYKIRQIGIGLSLPKGYDTLAWKRFAQWNVYPDDHIGRPEGIAQAFYPETQDTYLDRREEPKHGFNRDGNMYGSNDFRSTKHHLVSACFTAKSKPKVRVESNGHQALRSWIKEGMTELLVADYSNGGNEHYLSFDSSRTQYESELKMNGADFIGQIQLFID